MLARLPDTGEDLCGRWSKPINVSTGNYGSRTPGGAPYSNNYWNSPGPVSGPTTNYVGPLPPGWGSVLGNPWPHEYVGDDLGGSDYKDDVDSNNIRDLGSGNAKVNAEIRSSSSWERIEWEVPQWISDVLNIFKHNLQYVFPTNVFFVGNLGLSGVADLAPDLRLEPAAARGQDGDEAVRVPRAGARAAEKQGGD